MTTETIEPSVERDGNEFKLVQYGINDVRLAEMAEEYKDLTFDTPENYKVGHKALMVLVKCRTTLDKARKFANEEAQAFIKRNNGEANRLLAKIEAIEEPLRSRKKSVDDAKEAAERATVEAEQARIAKLEQDKRDAEEAQRKALHAAEEARLKEINERLQAERKAMEEEKAKIAVAQAKELARQRAEQAKLDAERRAVQAEKERLDRIELERQAKEKSENEAAIRAERARLQAIEDKRIADELALQEKARIEAARPDVEKIHNFGGSLIAFGVPTVESDEAYEFLETIKDELCDIAERCQAFTVETKQEVEF